jgi:hypothetical protein
MSPLEDGSPSPYLLAPKRTAGGPTVTPSQTC